MDPITYGFANDGRDKKPGTTKRIDRACLEALREGLPDERAVAVLVEINEGDDDNELAIAKDVFAGWQFFCTETHEVAAVTPDFTEARARLRWVKDSAVKQWSPRRSINVLHLGDDDPTVVFGHYAAGAHGQGDRPKWAQPLLNTSWDNMREAHLEVLRQLFARGRDVAWLMDVNAYDLDHVPGEQTIVHERTDWLRVRPAAGRTAHFKALRPVPFHLDSHDGQRMRGRFA